jgi:hypothetical protein
VPTSPRKAAAEAGSRPSRSANSEITAFIRPMRKR